MNLENYKPDAGKAVAGCLVGIILAVLAPLALLAELFSLMPLVLLPSIGLVFIARWSGRGPAVVAAIMQLIFTGMYLGSAFMWIILFGTVLPLTVLAVGEKRPFHSQMKRSIIAFGLGVVAAVALLNYYFGADMIERAILQLPELLKTLPAEALESVRTSFSMVYGSEATLEESIALFEAQIVRLLPLYRMNLPGQLFGGALITAVLCAGVNALMLKKSGKISDKEYVPLREWFMPASATGGLLLITAVSYFMSAVGMNGGETVFYTAFTIASTAFCIQAIASLARRLHVSPLKRGIKIAIAWGIAIMSLLGGNAYVAVYGCGSAVLGSRGALRQRHG